MAPRPEKSAESRKRGRPAGSKDKKREQSASFAAVCKRIGCNSTQYKIQPGSKPDARRIPASFVLGVMPNGFPNLKSAQYCPPQEGTPTYNTILRRRVICDRCGQHFVVVELRNLTFSEYNKIKKK